jgi:exodeoxyribonuclease V alpha subunit
MSTFENRLGMPYEEIIGNDFNEQIFSELDLQFARLMVRLAAHANRNEARRIFFAAASVSRWTGEGNVCLCLPRLIKEFEGKEQAADFSRTTDFTDWRQTLENSGVVGKPGDFKPIILDEGLRLYLYRYWEYEKKLIDFIQNRLNPKKICLGQEELALDKPLLQDTLKRLFPRQEAEYVDWGKIAVTAAVLNPFCVISGSPGTGKTTTIAKLLIALLEQGKGRTLRISLAAPTGKAAIRLQEAVKKNRDLWDCADGLKAAIPESATTIHRLLGSIQGSPYFRYNSSRLLPEDIIVIDEASMVDLPLLSKLVQAMAPHARLILAGDKDQLASAEAGTALGDICGNGILNRFSGEFIEKLRSYLGDDDLSQIPQGVNAGMSDCIVELQKNYRFGRNSGIAQASRAVKQGNGKQALAIMKSKSYTDIQWIELTNREIFYRELKNDIVLGFHRYLKAIAHGKALVEIFDAFEEFRILCALREGPFGVDAVNSYVERILLRESLIRPDARWYIGRPIMVTRNDYQLHLFNGDVGVIMPDMEENGQPRAFFRGADGYIRRISPQRLPQHETVYAMTVHKSQGSEFDRVLLILSDWDSPLITRELIYTGMTRAKTSVKIAGNEKLFLAAASRKISRVSGLREALWSGGWESEDACPKAHNYAK